MSGDTSLSASKALLGAALGGLLSLASVTCATNDAGTSSAGGAGGASASSSSSPSAGGASSTSNSAASTTHASSSAHAASSSTSASAGDGSGATGGSTASSGGAGGEAAASGGGGGASTASSGGAPVNGDTPFPDTTCDGGVSTDPMVTSSTMEVVTQQQFEDMCNARNGILETQPHCGGSNACRGFSYDSETQVLTEHTCRATNQCAGWSCVICS